MSARIILIAAIGVGSLGGLPIAAAPAAAQGSIAARVAAAPDGQLSLGYATRTGVCGDGGDVVALGGALTVYPSMESYGRWSGVKCVPGPARVVLTVQDHRVTGVRTHVGGTSGGGATDLGTVPAADAAAYFFTLARSLDGRDSRNALLPAVIADGGPIGAQLLSLAGDQSVSTSTRRRATHWAGLLGDASTVPALERLTSDTEASIAEAGLFALSAIPDGAGVPSLVRFARAAPDERRREKAVFWLGQSEREDALRVVREMAADRAAPTKVRGMAIFALGQRREGAGEFEYLRTLFPTLDDDALREKVLMAASQGGSTTGSRWLLDVARDAHYSDHVRRQAVFWAGPGGAATKDIAALYDGLDASSRAVREHTIFALSQRDDADATSKLMAIAKGDSDAEMRKKALFWLGQKDDPRVTKFITDLVTGN